MHAASPAASTSEFDGAAGEDASEVGHSVHLLNFRWLNTLRWVAVVGQTLAVVFVVVGLGVRLPVVQVALIIGGELLLNLIALRRGATQIRMRETELATWIGLDLATFTSLLHFTGGPSNPFSFFYIVHVAIASLTLSARLVWMLVLLSTVSYGVLFDWHVPLGRVGNDWNVYLYGAWVAYGLGASCIVYFLQRARATIREREHELLQQRHITEQAERLTSLATLAAGAAHELANPLSTIAVVSKELANELAQSNNQSAMQDVALVRSQVERCRKILARMAHTAGEAPGESNQWVSLQMLFEVAVEDLPERSRIVWGDQRSLAGIQLNIPLEAVAQSLRVLLDNALDVTSAPVKLTAVTKAGELLIEVEDEGAGIDEDVLKRVFEPFFTTKPAGKGMGLGLYLARNVAHGLGGSLSLSSRPKQGTRATLKVPSQRVRIQ
jgi:two-component system, sensor histidine kinase RegB